jgi:hypothetical protein
MYITIHLNLHVNIIICSWRGLQRLSLIKNMQLCREINMYKNIIIIHLILHVFFLRSKNTNVCTKMYVQKCIQPSWKWNNHIKCPVQGIIQNFQFKCIFLENVDITIQFPLHNRRISPILFHEWIGPVDPGHMWGQSAQNIIITIWYWSLYFSVLICREMNYGQIKKPMWFQLNPNKK